MEAVFAPQDVELVKRHLRLEVPMRERDLRIPDFSCTVAYAHSGA